MRHSRLLAIPLLCAGFTACAMPPRGEGPRPSLPGFSTPPEPSLAPRPTSGNPGRTPTEAEDFHLDLSAGFAPQDHDGPPRDRFSSPLRRDRFYAEASVAVGDLDHDDDFYGSDEVRARLVRIIVGGKGRRKIGFEGELRVLHPYDNSFEGSANEMDIDHFDLWFKFQAGIDHGRFRMPLRVGPYVSNLSTDLLGTGKETDYTSLGIRFELEPEVILTDLDTSPWVMSIYSKLGGGPHLSVIDDDVTNETFGSTGTSFHAEFGARAVLGGVNLSTSWVFQRYVVDESESEGSFTVPRVEDEFHGLMFTMGFRF